MARPDVVRLREFYGSPLGRITRRAIRDHILMRWPSLTSDTLAAIGYTTPFVGRYMGDEQADEAQVYPVMPASQGAVVWPSYAQNRVILADDMRLPFKDHSMNRVLLVHALENADSEDRLLRECWRVLVPGGRLMAVVPNRRSIWASSLASPFSYGRPYRQSQLKDSLCHNLFTHVYSGSTLLFMPSQSRGWLKIAPLLQRLGELFFTVLGGVIVMEVEKQIYAGIKEKARREKAPVYATLGKPALSRNR